MFLLYSRSKAPLQNQPEKINADLLDICSDICQEEYRNYSQFPFYRKAVLLPANRQEGNPTGEILFRVRSTADDGRLVRVGIQADAGRTIFSVGPMLCIEKVYCGFAAASAMHL